MKLHRITDNEVEFTADMTRQLFEDEPSNKHLTKEEFEERMRNYRNNNCVVYHFQEDGKVIGYAMVNQGRTPYYLIDFFICRDFRRNGYGRTAFYALLETLNTKTIDLDVFCWNSRGRKFWESLGFQELAIIMRKDDSK